MKDIDNLEKEIKDFVTKYFWAKPNENYIELEINGIDVTATRDKLHNDEYITASYNSKELIW